MQSPLCAAVVGGEICPGGGDGCEVGGVKRARASPPQAIKKRVNIRAAGSKQFISSNASASMAWSTICKFSPFDWMGCMKILPRINFKAVPDQTK